MKTIILGPPGTGKTTTLLNLVDEFLQSGIRPKEIGYFSFTRKAAQEAIDRASKRFNLDASKELIYFRTLHSFAFRLLGVKKEMIMNNSDYREFGEKFGIPVKYAEYSDEDGIFNVDSPYLRVINNARVRGISVLEEYDKNLHTIDIERDTLILLDRELTEFKKQKKMKDFTDLIIEFTQKDLSPKFKVLFIDEAQDLSFVQWQMVKSMWNKSEKTYIAGDDDQAIFEWAGADISHFVSLKEEVDSIQTLNVSYRIPGGPIHELSQRIINNVQNRYKKQYKPKADRGVLKYYTDVTQVDMSKGKWLVLATSHFFLEDVKDLCELQGWYYTHKGKNSIPLELLLAINNWEQWRNGSLLSFLEIKNIYSFLGPSVAPGFHQVKTLRSEEKYTIEDCKNHHGLIKIGAWYETFQKISTIEENYIRNMLAKGEQINKDPRIRLSTMHAAKGGEEDNVLIISDLTKAATISNEKNPDETRRLFYVATTRVKKELHIVEPKNFEKAFIL